MLRQVRTVLFAIYIVLGAYLILYSYNETIIPELIYDLNPLIFFIGGILLIFGGINYFRLRRTKKKEESKSAL